MGSTTHVGMNCDSQGKGYLVANYLPAGNQRGDYDSLVLALKDNVLRAGTPVELSPEEKAKALFRRFDKNGDGNISRAELQTVLNTLDPSVWTEKKVERLMSSLDLDGNGTVDYEEFLAWLFNDDINSDKTAFLRGVSSGSEG